MKGIMAYPKLKAKLARPLNPAARQSFHFHFQYQYEIHSMI